MAVIYSYPATAMRVCVDRIDGSKISGRLFCAQYEAPISFCDMGDLILKMEEIFDKRGHPDAFQTFRTFENTPRTTLHRHSAISGRAAPIEEYGKERTLLVYVMSRRNSSWQGKTVWLEDGESDIFNSALDFLRTASDKILGLGNSSKKIGHLHKA